MNIAIAALLCLTGVSAGPAHRHNIHRQLTPVEILNTFGTDGERVPQYDVVDAEVRHVRKRDGGSVWLLMVSGKGGNMDLELTPTDGFLVSSSTPVTWVTADEKGGFEFKDEPDMIKKLGHMMENNDTKSLFIIAGDKSRGDIVHGHIGSKNLTIRPLPERFARQTANSKTNQHVIFEHQTYCRLDFHDSNECIQTEQGDYATVTAHSELMQTHQPDGTPNALPVVPDTIYPEILVAVDASSYALHGSDINAVILYHLILWHFVSLRYKTLTNPEVRINIARFVVFLNEQSSPYGSDTDMGHDQINTILALDHAQSFWFHAMRSIPSPSYDAVMMFTGKKLLIKKKPSDGPAFTTKTAGMAFHASMCEPSQLYQLFPALSITQDFGDLDTAIVAHNLGHLFGMVHDSEHKGGCKDDDNHIMAGSFNRDMSDEARSNYWYFSNCSISTLQNDLRTYNRSCLYNKPVTKAKILPEIIWHASLAEVDFCTEISGPGSFSCGYGRRPTETQCLSLYCRPPGGQCFKTDHIPRDGFPCGEEDMYCELGRCVYPWGDRRK